MLLFVISLEYLAKPLMNFWHTRHFCRNLPFSYYNRHLSRIASLSPQLRLFQTFDGFLPNSPFSQTCHFRENRQLSIYLFCCLIEIFCQTFNESFAKFANFAKNVIFVKPTIIDMPPLSYCLHLCQTLINFCQICHLSRCPFLSSHLYLAKPLNSPFLPKFSFSPKFAIFL